MTRPRKEQVSVVDTPCYHIVSRCVRRSFLCGTDLTTGKSYELRRQWIEDRVRILPPIFGVEIAAYAVMSNHLHIVIKLSPDEVNSLTKEQVVERWLSLFKGPLLVQKWREVETLHPAELQAVTESINVYRKRLASLSGFMKCLNEPIARQANKEEAAPVTSGKLDTRPKPCLQKVSLWIYPPFSTLFQTLQFQFIQLDILICCPRVSHIVLFLIFI